MHKLTARILGVLVGLLAIVGFFVEGEHLMGLMNVDLTLDLIRVVLAVALLAVGFTRASARAARTVIAIVGVMYVAMGVVAFFDPTMFTLLPTGFTGFDIGFHLVVGIAAIVIAAVPDRTAGARSSTRSTPNRTV
ncbi:hypothetical protein [Pseudoclavibacter terrae]|uniref:DUF4383 domain-containing protein n=1 Tax=Pseudoclavibacter terrae TaxID=1530195 RepID=A0A7J5B8B2_9MICO|nr:hypothetical protein [Pseudoclavibacter terrae]KAB1639580.1 hypothetical protein F8O03_04425 [Pseudoclavibacter terrae]